MNNQINLGSATKRPLITIRLLVALMFGFIPSTQAQLIITSIADSGPGSLRETITLAPPDSVITFTNTLAGQVILLTNGGLRVNQNLTIDASALTGGLALDGDARGNVFVFASGTTNILAGLTLTNGNATASMGGAIYIANATLTISNCTLTGNAASGGGGIFNNSGILTVDHCKFVSNTATSLGGAILNGGGVIVLNNSELVGNSSELLGGGVYASACTLTISNSTFSTNSARDGGGLFLYRSTNAISDSTFSANTASGSGGGIFVNTNFSLAVNNTCFSENTASNTGGGINTYGTKVTVNNSTFSKNTANAGGGIYNYLGGTLIINNSTVSENLATYHPGGGGIHNSYTSPGSVFVTNSIVAGNSAIAEPVNIAGLFVGEKNLTNGIPLLAPLGFYGGLTQTMPPLPESPAIDAGEATTLTNDQRGFNRLVGSSVDIGAVEFQGRSDVTLFWSSDWDNDGLPFGVEFAIGTDPLVLNAYAPEMPAPYPTASGNGIQFGFNPAASNYVSWVVQRSLDLSESSFVEIYCYSALNGSQTAPNISASLSADQIRLTDDSNLLSPSAFYQLSIEPAP